LPDRSIFAHRCAGGERVTSDDEAVHPSVLHYRVRGGIIQPVALRWRPIWLPVRMRSAYFRRVGERDADSTLICRAKNVELETQGDQSDALHDLYCRTRSEGFGEEVQVSPVSTE
jgi:hypothetical protein